ncbi:hypothetical protein JHK82_019530 [Glycine max]|uniref:Uncharacterized protein n=1 Tax=Glycine max TaxID=3847 RepID=I1KMB6_SOYBN|nr:hypothetical protein JHK87_019403 [Glycine soja]KAG5023628.1 hypothetical protein JHK85_019970 [Glycine max]KAG5038704.1 hypothetical protein JHK86_019544 [Glycine max]KAG5143835.1 hypothetical protein JHK82_019530 [Glycine max]
MAVESIFEGVNCIFCGIFLFMANPVLKQLDVVSKLTRSSSKNEQEPHDLMNRGLIGEYNCKLCVKRDVAECLGLDPSLTTLIPLYHGEYNLIFFFFLFAGYHRGPIPPPQPLPPPTIREIKPKITSTRMMVSVINTINQSNPSHIYHTCIYLSNFFIFLIILCY